MREISIGVLNGIGLGAIKKNVDARVKVEEKLCLWDVTWDIERDVIDEIEYHNEFGGDDHGYHY